MTLMRYFLPFLIILIITSCNEYPDYKSAENKNLIRYFDNGKIHIAVDTLNKKFEGSLYQFYPNGKTKLKMTWHKGLPIDTLFFYSDDTTKKIHKFEQNNISTAYSIIDLEDKSYRNFYYDLSLIKLFNEYFYIDYDSTFYPEGRFVTSLRNIPSEFLRFYCSNGIAYWKPEGFIYRPRTAGRDVNFKFSYCYLDSIIQLKEIDKRVINKN